MTRVNTIRTDIPIANQRRADILSKAAHAHQTSTPFPSLQQIADQWDTHTKTVCQFMRQLREVGMVQTEKRGEYALVVALFCDAMRHDRGARRRPE